MGDAIDNSGRRRAVGLAVAALVTVGAAGAPAPVAVPGEDAAAQRAGAAGEHSAVWGGAPASDAFAAGAPPSVAAALAPAEAGEGERTGAVEGATLSVRVSGDRDTIVAGEDALYTVAVRNNGVEPHKAIVSQRVSAEAQFVDVGADGIATGGVATWRVPIEGGAEAQRTARVRLGESGKKLWRVATTVCIQTAAGEPPVACATDASRVEHEARSELSAAAHPESVLTVASILTGTVIVLGTVVTVFVLWNRLRLGPRIRRPGKEETG